MIHHRYSNWDRKLNFRHNSQNWRRIYKSLKEKKKKKLLSCVYKRLILKLRSKWFNFLLWIILVSLLAANAIRYQSFEAALNSWIASFKGFKGTNHIFAAVHIYIYSNFFITNAKRKETKKKKKKTLTTHIHKLIQY